MSEQSLLRLFIMTTRRNGIIKGIWLTVDHQQQNTIFFSNFFLWMNKWTKNKMKRIRNEEQQQLNAHSRQQNRVLFFSSLHFIPFFAHSAHNFTSFLYWLSLCSFQNFIYTWDIRHLSIPHNMCVCSTLNWLQLFVICCFVLLV